MKKIFACMILIAISFIAKAENKTYNIEENLYFINNDEHQLISSVSYFANNEYKRNLSFLSKEKDSKNIDLNNGILVTAIISPMGKYDVIDYVGNLISIDNKGSLKNKEILKSSMFLDDSKKIYESALNINGKKYLMQMKISKVDYIAETKEVKIVF